MSPRTEEQFEDIREGKKKLILDTALGLFANKGYHATSISMITKEVGISKGLIYNYFKSKEYLLTTIFHKIIFEVMDMINPNHDDVITDDEAEGFFDNFFDVLVANPEEWKLFYQLTIQPDVMEFLLKESHSHTIQSSQKLIYSYFLTRDFEDTETAILLFSSIFKGFALQYAFAPEMFTQDMLDKFKAKLKELFLRKSVPGKEVKEMDENMGYFLL